jgi:hypothetical protein
MSARDTYDVWLEYELRRRLHGLTAVPVPRARYEAFRAGRRSARWVSGAGAAIAAKATTGLVVAAFAVGATGTALSGSANPSTWESTAHQVVDQCKAGASVEGIGGCVMAIEHPQPIAVTAPDTRPATPSPDAHRNTPAAVAPASTGRPARFGDHDRTSPSFQVAPTPLATRRPVYTPLPTPSHSASPSPSPSPRPSPSANVSPSPSPP